MRKLNLPIEKVNDIVDLIKDDYTFPNKKDEVENLRELLIANELIYEEKVEQISLFEIDKITSIGSIDLKKILVNFYESRLLKKDLKARHFYDNLLISVENNECPYCTIREVSTVDHFLPKSEYPLYAIAPLNLIPCCSDCNKLKLDWYPTSVENQLFHPYFDNVESDVWIRAKLIDSEPIYFVFEVIKPSNWNEIQFERAKYYFELYQLNKLFSSNANKVMREFQILFRRLINQDPSSSSLLAFLNENYESYLGVGKLYWKTILFDELRTNQWFLNGCQGSSFLI